VALDAADAADAVALDAAALDAEDAAALVR
jgi:hypothetical protein